MSKVGRQRRLTSRRALSGFTLVEILTVVVIIGILVAILMPAVQRVRQQANKRKAQTEIAVIRNAVKAYFTEYGEWPVPSSAEPDDDGLMAFESDNDDVLALLQPDETKNTRHLVFIEEDTLSRETDGPFVDPWGVPYRITMDIKYPGPEATISAGVMVKSGTVDLEDDPDEDD